VVPFSRRCPTDLLVCWEYYTTYWRLKRKFGKIEDHPAAEKREQQGQTKTVKQAMSTTEQRAWTKHRQTSDVAAQIRNIMDKHSWQLGVQSCSQSSLQVRDQGMRSLHCIEIWQTRLHTICMSTRAASAMLVERPSAAFDAVVEAP
jgi:hypothetical protein